MGDEREELNLGLVKEFKEKIHETKHEDLNSAVKDLRELGDSLEKNDPHFFEEEKFKEILKSARKFSKEL